ncbi:DUF3618 domain-containing protein [Aeromicrobium sp.]|uniref:DUF3618 domain-containing protein n=1 Tax=Aeromicrobium sp. TaxID=1871063 RepID=UPI001999CDD3|nr:DUF3618 domain-containing protein [Aeromicrobium sp.]MBC7632920.1 DUF3618 domain-containing protein [Aeromicrobium sp.]
MTDRLHNGATGPGPDATISELESDIERTRQQLGETIDALGAKLDVKAQLRSSADQAKTNLADAATQATRTAASYWQEIAVLGTTALALIIVWRRY